MCCPNFISPGIARCENCNSPAGELFDCPVCGNDVLKGETYCYRCHSYISKDGTRGGESSWDVSEDREFDNALEDPDEFESEREEESDQFDW
jgi:predicted amidophosphoribosyltransferase